MATLQLREALLQGNDIYVLDGGVSTHLENQGHKFKHAALWSSSLLLNKAGQTAIAQGHVDWCKAGADIISTVTYQCHYEESLWPSSVITNSKQMDEMMETAVQLARQANSRWVATSLGCYGGALANGAEYTGDYPNTSQESLVRFHKPRYQRAVALFPDAIAFETIPSLLEVKALVQLLLLSDNNSRSSKHQQKKKQQQPACWISLACRNDTELNDGTPVTTALKLLRQVPVAKLQGIGFNCCSLASLSGLVDVLIKDNDRAIVIYPNSGEDYNGTSHSWEPGTGCTNDQEFANALLGILQKIRTSSTIDPLPTILVGGCCRTRPAAIAALQSGIAAMNLGS
jgi:homocysteine S-methyltransferase